MAAANGSDHPALHTDARGPRSIRLLAALVEAEARRFAAAAADPRAAASDLVVAFRGGAEATAAATPISSVSDFLERIQFFIRFDGSCYVLAGIYLMRFIRSPAAREAGVLIEPRTAHRLVAVALFLATKFHGNADELPSRWARVFEVSSSSAIRTGEMAPLEWSFLRAIGFQLFVDGEDFGWFCRVLERGPRAPPRSHCGRKRKATAAGEVEDDRRRVQPCLPPPVLASN
ncbi:hypothetical protein ACP70R_004322 [Stipagrostis hirtigluma subsp. patula]